MEVSRLTISEETSKNMFKDLTPMQKGELLFGRLEEIEKDGRLSKCKTRKDVVEAVGYAGGSGLSWIGNLIRRGALTETFRAFSKDNRAEDEYHIGVRPKFSHTSRRKKKVETPARPQQLTALTGRSKNVIVLVSLSDEDKIVEILKGLLQ